MQKGRWLILKSKAGRWIMGFSIIWPPPPTNKVTQVLFTHSLTSATHLYPDPGRLQQQQQQGCDDASWDKDLPPIQAPKASVTQLLLGPWACHSVPGCPSHTSCHCTSGAEEPFQTELFSVFISPAQVCLNDIWEVIASLKGRLENCLFQSPDTAQL